MVFAKLSQALRAKPMREPTYRRFPSPCSLHHTTTPLLQLSISPAPSSSLLAAYEYGNEHA
jgi:hypothetical protein